MTDQEFLTWLRDRLVHQYGENPNVDFVLRLDTIIAADAVTREGMAYRRADLRSAILGEKRRGRNTGLLHAAARAVAFFDDQLREHE